MELDTRIFNRLKAIQWFSQCGKISNLDFGFKRVEWLHDWPNAAKHFTSIDWEDTTLQARNALTMHLSKRYQNDFQDWNKLTIKSRDQITNDIMPIVNAFQQQNNLSPAFGKCVRWDILAATMELTYKPCHPPIFFTKLLSIYEDGHFPCGWHGEWPNGHLVAF